MRLRFVSLGFATALTLLGLCTEYVGAQTFKAKFGTGTWTAFGSVRTPKDDIWTPGVGPAGEFWISPGGAWFPTPGSPIRNPRADTWLPAPSANASPRTSSVPTGSGQDNSQTVREPTTVAIGRARIAHEESSYGAAAGIAASRTWTPARQ